LNTPVSEIGTHDKDIYKDRHLIEDFFDKLKQYKAIATRYDKTAQNFFGAIYLVATLIWLDDTHYIFG
jgi:transposase